MGIFTAAQRFLPVRLDSPQISLDRCVAHGFVAETLSVFAGLEPVTWELYR